MSRDPEGWGPLGPQASPRRLQGTTQRPQTALLVVALLAWLYAVGMLVSTWRGTTDLVRVGVPPEIASAGWSLLSGVAVTLALGLTFLVLSERS